MNWFLILNVLFGFLLLSQAQKSGPGDSVVDVSQSAVSKSSWGYSSVSAGKECGPNGCTEFFGDHEGGGCGQNGCYKYIVEKNVQTLNSRSRGNTRIGGEPEEYKGVGGEPDEISEPVGGETESFFTSAYTYDSKISNDRSRAVVINDFKTVPVGYASLGGEPEEDQGAGGEPDAERTPGGEPDEFNQPVRYKIRNF